jgi:hypothetical protein
MNNQTSRKGWRHFNCPDCGQGFKEATRDRHSPSGTDCPKCGGWCSPERAEMDNLLPTDASGNLTNTWEERIVLT